MRDDIDGVAELAALQLTADGVEVDAELAPSTGLSRALRATLPAGTVSTTIRYTVTLEADRGFRYPLPVPVGGVDPDGSIQVELLLPPGARYRTGFPRLSAAGQQSGRRLMRARVAGVPTFVHAEFGRGLGPVGWLTLLGAVLLAFAAAAAVFRRRAAQYSNPAP